MRKRYDKETGMTIESGGAEDGSVQVKQKSSMRRRADAIKAFRCRNLIAVIEEPADIVNIATIIRNVNALGVEKVYVVDPRRTLPDDWQEFRQQKAMGKLSVSGSKWSFVKRFDSTEECLAHLEAQGFQSIVTSPHVKGKVSVNLSDGDYTTQPKLAVWFGNESRGISPLAVERSSMCVAIPMFGMVESFNLGTTSGIVLYEVTRQRRAYQAKYRNRGGRGLREVPLPTVMDTVVV
jgi:tRNA (guanosine-2'-O-)-methyltransferase